MWLRVNEKEVIFNIFNAVKNPYTEESCFSIQAIDLLSSKGLINKKSR